MIGLKRWFGWGNVERDRQAWTRAYVRTIQARYDAAQTTIENERYWAAADGKSARAAHNADIRRKLCQRARYEAAESGSYANGVILAKVGDVVGRGAVLQMRTERPEINATIERHWNSWCREVGLHAKVRVMVGAYFRDGEAFAERILNPRLLHAVKLDIRLSECDLWTDPNSINTQNTDDGITYDDAGVPVSYKRLRQHPGDDFAGVNSLQVDDIDAINVIHWFRADRPDQRRGVTHLAPALSLFADLRRYRLATVAAAEVAANFSAVMYSDASAFSESPDEVDENFLSVSLERRAMLTLPAGWKMEQLRAEQPTTAFSSFVDSVLQEAGRCLQMPLNIIGGTSKDYSFASGRLDYLLYWNANDIVRSDCELVVYDRIFAWFLEELLTLPDILPDVDELFEFTRQFVFPPRQPIDIEAQANADETYFNLGLLTDEEWAARQAKDVEQHYAELEAMLEVRKKLGAPTPNGQGKANEETKNGASPNGRTARTSVRRGRNGGDRSERVRRERAAQN